MMGDYHNHNHDADDRSTIHAMVKDTEKKQRCQDPLPLRLPHHLSVRAFRLFAHVAACVGAWLGRTQWHMCARNRLACI